MTFPRQQRKANDFLEQGLKLMERKRIGAVGKRLGRVIVHFEKDSVDADGGAGTCEWLDEFGLAAA